MQPQDPKPVTVPREIQLTFQPSVSFVRLPPENRLMITRKERVVKRNGIRKPSEEKGRDGPFPRSKSDPSTSQSGRTLKRSSTMPKMSSKNCMCGHDDFDHQIQSCVTPGCAKPLMKCVYVGCTCSQKCTLNSTSTSS